MSGELQRLGQSLLDLIHEISTIGEFRSVVKKDCQGLKGWVGLLSHLFEEIRDFGNGDGSGGSLFQECVSCLGELLLALEGAKRVLELGRSGSDVFLITSIPLFSENICCHGSCPKTQQKLLHLLLTPNYVMRSLIAQWCETHGVEQPQGSTKIRARKSDGSIYEVSRDRSAIDALVRKLSSQSQEEQRSVVAEIRFLTKRSTDNRILIVEAGPIPVLVNLLFSGELRIQEHAVTAILNLSIYKNSKGLMVQAGGIPLIIEVLRLGTMEARENAATTLFSLSLVNKNKITIGASGATPALVELLDSGSPRGKKDAATALFNLHIYQGNKTRVVRVGILVFEIEGHGLRHLSKNCFCQ